MTVTSQQRLRGRARSRPKNVTCRPPPGISVGDRVAAAAERADVFDDLLAQIRGPVVRERHDAFLKPEGDERNGETHEQAAARTRATKPSRPP